MLREEVLREWGELKKRFSSLPFDWKNQLAEIYGKLVYPDISVIILPRLMTFDTVSEKAARVGEEKERYEQKISSLEEEIMKLESEKNAYSPSIDEID